MISAWAIAAINAFNLACTGTMFVHDPADPYSPPDAREVSETYRIDLEKKRWCLDECTTTIPIAKIEPTLITLQDIKTPTLNVETYSVTVNRESGILFSMLKIGGMETRMVLQCEPRPFTGFPPLKF